MRPSPLHIEQYFVKDLRFSLKPGFDENTDRETDTVEPPALKVGVDARQHVEEKLRWRFEISIELSDASESKFPYTFSVVMVGHFRIDEKFPAEKAEMVARVNAPSLLYSAAREILASVTGRSPYPAILLPSISFIPVQEEVKAKAAPEKSTTKQPSKKTGSKPSTKKAVSKS